MQEFISGEIVIFADDIVKIIDILKFFVAFVLSYFSRFIFINFSKQNWLKSYSNTLSFLILPMIAYGVTTIISDNIALSLGLVGALSIVRFRTPVKNPFELIAYFYLLTIGIILSVSFTMAVIFVVSISLVIMFVPVLVKDTYMDESFDLYSENYIMTFTSNSEAIESEFKDLKFIYKNLSGDIFTYRYIFNSMHEANLYMQNIISDSLIEYTIEKSSII